MSIEKNHEECCGFEFEKNKFPFFGVLTLAYPLHLLILFATLATLPFKGQRHILFVHNLGEATARLIKKQSYCVDFKCSLTAATLRRSRRFSRFLFSQFNFLILTLCWIGIFLLLWGAQAWM